MSVPFITFLVGLSLIVVAILGGGVEVKEVKIPPLGILPRLLSFLLGSALLAVWFGKQEWLSPDHDMTVKKEQPTSSSSDEPQAPSGRSVWLVDKSLVYLEATGDKRQFFVLKPSVELSAAGAQFGSQLFDGRNIGDVSYEGTLFYFAKRCGTREYNASGPISNGGLTVTLTGTAPQIDVETCMKTGEQEQKLIFNFKH
jgi:hypothetical protein